jgi:DNA modification methylase
MNKIKLSELKKLEWNPRTIKKEDLDKLTKSIEKFWVIEWRPFLVSNRTGENIIIWWNQRYEVCKKLGIKEVPVHIMEWLTEEEEKEIIIRDNISNWEWDWDILANEWDKDELEEWGLDVQFETVEPEAEEDDFELDEGIQTDIVLGDLFEIWPHRLLCGDSTNIDDVNKLMNGEKADMVFTDPPYNMGYKWTMSNTTVNWVEVGHIAISAKYDDIKNDKMNEEEFYTFISDAITNIKKFCEWAYYISFWSWTLYQLLKPLNDLSISYKSIIIWMKNQSTISWKDFKSRYEPIVYWRFNDNFFWERFNEEDIWEFQRTLKNDLHPTMKPVPLIEKALKSSSKEWMKVLDLFWWSGSTMVVCHQLNRKCYMSELDPKYVQTIINRMIKLNPTLEIKRNWAPYKIIDNTTN